jgi:hypothetical protein
VWQRCGTRIIFWPENLKATVKLQDTQVDEDNIKIDLKIGCG